MTDVMLSGEQPRPEDEFGSQNRAIDRVFHDKSLRAIERDPPHLLAFRADRVKGLRHQRLFSGQTRRSSALETRREAFQRCKCLIVEAQ